MGCWSFLHSPGISCPGPRTLVQPIVHNFSLTLPPLQRVKRALCTLYSVKKCHIHSDSVSYKLSRVLFEVDRDDEASTAEPRSARSNGSSKSALSSCAPSLPPTGLSEGGVQRMVALLERLVAEKKAPWTQLLVSRGGRARRASEENPGAWAVKSKRASERCT